MLILYFKNTVRLSGFERSEKLYRSQPVLDTRYLIGIALELTIVRPVRLSAFCKAKIVSKPYPCTKLSLPKSFIISASKTSKSFHFLSTSSR